jgi:uncharacterized protein YxjI
MNNLNYPLNFTFKIGSFANDFVITDANKNTLSYVRQKMFKLKEDILCYSDETKSSVLYRIRANKWLDYSATYSFSDQHEQDLGKVARKGRASLWKATYEVLNKNDIHEFTIKEENPWAKVLDAVLTEIPILGLLTGYLFNPKYVVLNSQGQIVLRLKKEASFFGRKFTLEKLGGFSDSEQERIILSLMMMILLERRRG